MAEEKKTTLTKRPSAKKRELQGKKRELLNRQFKSKTKTAIKDFQAVLSGNDAAAIQTKLSEVFSLMDMGVKKGIFKVNKAARVKSRMKKKQVKQI